MRRWWALTLALLPAACVDLGPLSGASNASSQDGGGDGGTDAIGQPSDGGVDGSDGAAGPDGAPPDGATSGGCNGTVDCERVVFVTHATYIGGLGGIAGADQKCQFAADSSASPRVQGRKFAAWLSGASTPVTLRLTHGAGRYVRPDLATIAPSWTGLTGGVLAVAITIDESGFQVGGNAWTGTSIFGTELTGATCLDWMSAADANMGQVGDVTNTADGWTNASAMMCSVANHLYCIEL